MKKAEPNKGEDGRIYADLDGGWYYLTELLDDGNERRLVSSNALFHVQESATRYSVGAKNWKIRLGDILLIDGRTHKAIAFYEKNRGLKEGWQEEDDSKTKPRQEAYQRGDSLINHQNK